VQLIDVRDAVHLFDLKDVLSHLFQQGFTDPKWRSVAWLEECTSARLKASHAMQELLAWKAEPVAGVSVEMA